MDASYTPGPWKFSRRDDLGDTRFYVSQEGGAPYTPHYSDVATLIAETVSDERRSIQEANARLISAAPELLAAALRFKEYELACASGDDIGTMVLYAEASSLMNSAIAKAIGDQT